MVSFLLYPRSSQTNEITFSLNLLLSEAHLPIGTITGSCFPWTVRFVIFSPWKHGLECFIKSFKYCKVQNRRGFLCNDHKNPKIIFWGFCVLYNCNDYLKGVTLTWILIFLEHVTESRDMPLRMSEKRQNQSKNDKCPGRKIIILIF